MSKTANTSAGPLRATWICLALSWAFFLLPLPGLSLVGGVSMCLATFILSIVVMAKGNSSGGLIPLLLTLIASPFVWFLGMGIMAMLLNKGMADLHDQGYGLTPPAK